MPLRTLIDTGVMLDLILAREPWLGQAKPLWDARDAGQLECAVLASALTDIYYICRKSNHLGPKGAAIAVEMVIQRFEILTVDRTAASSAIMLRGPDFEDNVQIACAMRDGIDVIVTRDKAGFRQSSVPAVEPADIIHHSHVPEWLVSRSAAWTTC